MSGSPAAEVLPHDEVPATAPDGAIPAELARLLAEFRLAPDHPPECHAEARAWLAAPGLDDPALVDLEGLPFVTIDNDDSRDLDQALYIGPHPTVSAGHVVWYALADAAHYVRPGSALFTEALRRGASYYLPDLVVPMLPVSLSEGLVSLNEGVQRRAVVFRVELDPIGEVLAVEIQRARIKSRKKLSYRGVQRHWDGEDPSLSDTDFGPSLAALRIVGAQRVALAEARQVVHYQRLEIEVGTVPGPRFVAFEARRYETDRMNEQISLLVNVEGARLLAARVASDRPGSPLQAIFRVHPAPLSEDLTALARLTRAVASSSSHAALAWSPEDEPLARWLERIAQSPPELLGVVLALQRQALLLNQRSTFAAAPGLHYGVAAACYARFTAPMREVVGIFTHKEALELLGLLPPGSDDDTLRETVIDAANRAKELQHQLTKAANLLVIEPLLTADLALPEAERPRRAGTVLGLAPDKAYVLLDDPPLELKVYARDLGPRYRLVEEASALVIHGQSDAPDLVLRLGERVALTVTGRARDRFTLRPEPASAPALASPPA